MPLLAKKFLETGHCGSAAVALTGGDRRPGVPTAAIAAKLPPRGTLIEIASMIVDDEAQTSRLKRLEMYEIRFYGVIFTREFPRSTFLFN